MSLGPAGIREIAIKQTIVPEELALFDNFEDTLFKWRTFGGTAGDYSVSRDTNTALIGEASANLSTPATAVVNDYAACIRYVPLNTTPEKINCSVSFMSQETASDVRISMAFGVAIQAESLDTLEAFYLRWTGTSWAYRNSGGGFTDISGLPALTTDTTEEIWHKIQIIGRPIDGTIISAKVDDTEVALNVDSFGSAASGSNHVECTLDVTSLNTASQKTVYFDNVRIAIEDDQQ